MAKSLTLDNTPSDALDMLGQMSPWDYHSVRVMLGHGSGFDSPGFRRVAEVTQRVTHAFDALERAPTRAPYHYELGLILRESGKAPEAIEAWKQAVKLEPGPGSVWNV